MEKPLLYDEMKEKTDIAISYKPLLVSGVTLEVVQDALPPISAWFTAGRIDEAHILYMEATELVRSRVSIGQSPSQILEALKVLFALFRNEKVLPQEIVAVSVPRVTSLKLKEEGTSLTASVPNPGKSLEIDVDGVTYLRLPVKTRLIDTHDKDILPVIEEYALPRIHHGDLFFVSEKALTITQGRVVDMSDIHPGSLARMLARNVGNSYGTQDFHGFGHGTSLAMQLFIEEAGYMRVLFAAAVSAITRPLGIRGAFYYLCGKSAKSIDCPMSFLILEYAHAAKLAPKDSDGEARRIREKIGCETVILDANYRGAFSLGKSSSAITEEFIGKLFRDNPLGQSDEMTPFCIVRKANIKSQALDFTPGPATKHG